MTIDREIATMFIEGACSSLPIPEDSSSSRLIASSKDFGALLAQQFKTTERAVTDSEAPDGDMKLAAARITCANIRFLAEQCNNNLSRDLSGRVTSITNLYRAVLKELVEGKGFPNPPS